MPELSLELQRVHLLSPAGSATTAASPSSTTSAASTSPSGKVDVLSVRHITRGRPLHACDLRHEVRRHVFQVWLCPRLMQWRIMSQVRQVKRVRSEMCLRVSQMTSLRPALYPP